MKKILYLIFALIMCSEVVARERSALKVTFTDGTTATLCTNYNLSIAQYYDMEMKNFILSFLHTDNDLPDGSGDGVSVKYIIEQIKNMQFVGTETDIESLVSDHAAGNSPTFYLSGKSVTVIGANKSEVAAYSIEGKVPAAAISGSDGRVTLDFTAAQPGVYIIKTSAKPIKVRIR